MNATSSQITIIELCECDHITEEMLVAAVEHEIVVPATGQHSGEWVFDATHVTWIHKAIRLHQDLELDWVAIAMLIDLLREKEQLERANEALHKRLQRLLGD